jgi:hypothetical protein
MYTFANDSAFDVKALRTRLARIYDATLVRFGHSAAYICSAWANHGRKPREVFVLQLREAREEWRCRQAQRAITQDVQ